MSALWALALIMLCSGVAKLATHSDVAATFTRLKVSRPFHVAWLARAFPALEIALAGALVQPVAVLRGMAALAAVALFAAFLVLVVRAKGDGVSCGCFGDASEAPISTLTVVRNVLFLVLAALALIEALVAFAAVGLGIAWLPLAAFGPGVWAWSLTVTLLLTGSAFLVGRESSPSGDAGALTARAIPAAPVHAGAASAAAGEADGDDGGADGDDGEEPPRHPFPDSVIVRAGQYGSLHRLAQSGAVVALRLSVGCGPCSTVIARLPEFAARLGPVRLRVLMPQHALDRPVPTGTIDSDLILADPAGQASTALGLTSFPSAVLLGTDLLTAGGPVFGADAVLEFLEELCEVVTTELPSDAPTPAADLPQESRP